MKTEIVINLPLIKRWILKAFIGGLLKNLDKSQIFYKETEDYKGKNSEAGKMYGNQKKGIEQSINKVREYCGMNIRDFRTEEWIAEEDEKDAEKGVQ